MEMKYSKLLLSMTAIVFIAAMGCSTRYERVLSKEQGPDNRCHMKIERYGDASTHYDREVVDYYGPCDERPDLPTTRPE